MAFSQYDEYTKLTNERNELEARRQTCCSRYQYINDYMCGSDNVSAELDKLVESIINDKAWTGPAADKCLAAIERIKLSDKTAKERLTQTSDDIETKLVNREMKVVQRISELKKEMEADAKIYTGIDEFGAWLEDAADSAGEYIMGVFKR